MFHQRCWWEWRKFHSRACAFHSIIQARKVTKSLSRRALLSIHLWLRPQRTVNTSATPYWKIYKRPTVAVAAVLCCAHFTHLDFKLQSGHDLTHPRSTRFRATDRSEAASQFLDPELGATLATRGTEQDKVYKRRL
jgi:hypothetical protein